MNWPGHSAAVTGTRPTRGHKVGLLSHHAPSARSRDLGRRTRRSVAASPHRKTLKEGTCVLAIESPFRNGRKHIGHRTSELLKSLLEACFSAIENLRLQTRVTVPEISGMQISCLKGNGSQRPGKTPP